MVTRDQTLATPDDVLSCSGLGTRLDETTGKSWVRADIWNGTESSGVPEKARAEAPPAEVDRG